jgi:hypothetical protein
MKIYFKTKRFPLNGKLVQFFQEHASFVPIDENRKQITDIDCIDEDVIQLIDKSYLDSLSSFINFCQGRMMPDGMAMLGQISMASQSKEERIQFWKGLLLGKVGFSDFRDEICEKLILCKTIIENEQYVQFETNYEFEAPEIRVENNLIKIKGASRGAIQNLYSEEERNAFFTNEMKVEEVDLILEPLQKAFYLFFLNHPEGVKWGDIRKTPYREEITAIYNQMPKGADLESLFLPKNSQKRSEIKTRINKEIKEKAKNYAGFYTISGEKNERLSINLFSVYPELIKK